MAYRNGAVEAATTDDSQSNEKQKQTRDLIKDGFKGHTKGETLFNRIVYGGLGFGLVTGVSIAATWLLRDTKHISKSYSALIEKVQTTFKGKRTGDALAKFNDNVDSAMTIGALFTGGTVATVLPVKWMEDNKSNIVKSLDKKIYGADEVANNPDIIAAHHQLDIAPKQTWKSVFVSRVVAFAGTFATWFAVGKSIDKWSIKSGRSLDKVFRAKDSVAAQEISHMQQVSPEKMHRNGTDVDRISTRIWNYIAQDGFYTALTSISLFVSTRIFGPIFDKPHTDAAPAQLTSVQDAVITKDSGAIDTSPIPSTAAAKSDEPLTKVSAIAHNAMLQQPSAPTLMQGA